jgi:tripartite-type tricarboxylate transporter receptor subunit TctC
VPFGAAQVVTSSLGGHADTVVQLPATIASYVQIGQVRLLASLTAERDPAFPDVPTAREQGYDVALEAWRGIAVPKGTPKKVIAVLEEAIKKTVQSREFAETCERLNVHPAFLPSAEFGELIAQEDAKLARIMDTIGLKKQ